MTEISFYHLTKSKVNSCLPELVEKAIARDLSTRIIGPDQESLQMLSQALWQWSDTSFLAHGFCSEGDSDQEKILLCTEQEQSTGGELAIYCAGAAPQIDQVSSFGRLCYLFDGQDDQALADARKKWVEIVNAGLGAVYFSQESGRWQEKLRKNG